MGVTSVTIGGEFFAIYTFFTETVVDQRKLKLKIEGSGIVSGVTVDASLEVKMSTFLSETKTSSKFNCAVSGTSNVKLPTPDKLVEFTLAFPLITLDAPKMIAFATEGYENVPDAPDIGKIVRNRRYFVGDGAVGGLGEPLIRISALRTAVARLEDIYRRYKYEHPELQTFHEALIKDELAIKTQFSGYQDDPLSDFTRPNLPSLDVGTPTLNVKDMSRTFDSRLGNHYVQRGVAFDAMPVRQAILEQRRLYSIRIAGAEEVDCIKLTYENSGGILKEESYGGNGGTMSSLITLVEGEYLSVVSVLQTSVVAGCAIETSNGRVIQAGRSLSKDPLQWQRHIFESGDPLVIGISGRSDDRVCELSLLVVVFLPTLFVK